MAINSRRVGVSSAKAGIWACLRGGALTFVELHTAFTKSYSMFGHRFDDGLRDLLQDEAVTKTEDHRYMRAAGDAAFRVWRCETCGASSKVPLGRLDPEHDCDEQEAS